MQDEKRTGQRGLLNDILVLFFVEHLKLWNKDLVVVADGHEIAIVAVDVRTRQVDLLMVAVGELRLRVMHAALPTTVLVQARVQVGRDARLSRRVGREAQRTMDLQEPTARATEFRREDVVDDLEKQIIGEGRFPRRAPLPDWP